MSHIGIFIYGSIVAVIVLAAYALMIWASIEDGREHRGTVQPEPGREPFAAPDPAANAAQARVPVGVE